MDEEEKLDAALKKVSGDGHKHENDGSIASKEFKSSKEQPQQQPKEFNSESEINGHPPNDFPTTTDAKEQKVEDEESKLEENKACPSQSSEEPESRSKGSEESAQPDRLPTSGIETAKTAEDSEEHDLPREPEAKADALEEESEAESSSTTSEESSTQPDKMDTSGSETEQAIETCTEQDVPMELDDKDDARVPSHTEKEAKDSLQKHEHGIPMKEAFRGTPVRSGRGIGMPSPNETARCTGARPKVRTGRNIVNETDRETFNSHSAGTPRSLSSAMNYNAQTSGAQKKRSPQAESNSRGATPSQEPKPSLLTNTSSGGLEDSRIVDGVNLNDWFFQQLDALGLKRYYPGKLKLKDLIKIFPGDIDSAKHSSQAFQFLQKLSHVNQLCRSIFESEASLGDLDEEFPCSYSTAIMAIFLCADPFLRRFLAEKMQMCQFAIPFILPHTGELLLWPLRIIRNWTSSNTGVIEGCVASECMSMFSVMQLGEFDRCVSSELLNMIFGETGYNGFNEVVNEGPNVVSDGLVEIGFYLPRGRESDSFSQSAIAAHLCGDARNAKVQVQYLSHVSESVVIVTNDLEEAVDFLQHYSVREKVVIALNTTRSKLRELKPKLEKVPYKVIPFVHQRDIVKSLRAHIKERMGNSVKSLEDRALLGTEFGFKLDEMNADCQTGKDLAKEVMKYVEDQDVYATRRNILYFQETWKEWTRLDKEQTRRKNFEHKDSAKAHIERCELDKQKIEEQLKWGTLSACFKRFLAILKQNDVTKKLYFLEWLRYYLDERSRFVSHQLQLQMDHGSVSKEVLADIGTRLAQSSFGLEHFLREIGLTWAIITKKLNKQAAHLLWLPKLIANLLLEGYPLEILDGDASFVHISWIRQVFHNVNEILGCEARVFVTSILGVQSSGKSTFLNTMFGISFAVKSGRCTKGAFLQMVEVDPEIRKTLGCDYLAVIDTEGLKSAELVSYDSKKDNELGTLAVGVADLSVMNVGGENDDSMKDVLEIICYAFLRMTVVRQEKPKCMMVHQNVGDLAAAHNTTTGKLKFFQTLDKMTQMAAELENCSQTYQKFGDVIDYDRKKMDIYIPGLWQGSPPMASVNIDYAEASQKTKKALIEEVFRMNSSSLSDLATRISDVFTAVKQENFIFSFQNTLAAKAHQNLAQHFNDVKWKGKTIVLNWITSTEIHLREANDLTNNKKTEVLDESEVVIQQYASKMQEVLRKYFEEHEEVVSLLERSRSMFEDDILRTEKSTRQEVQRKIEEMFFSLRNEERVEKVASSGEKHFHPRLLELKKKYALAERNLTEEQKVKLTEDFEHEWALFLNDIEGPRIDETVDIGYVMQTYLLSFIPGHTKHLKQEPSSVLEHEVKISDLNIRRSLSKKIQQTFADNAPEWMQVVNPRQTILRRAQTLVNQILTACATKIESQTQVSKPFREEMCMNILHETSQLIDSAKDKDFEFSMEFKVVFIQKICCYATDKLWEMHFRFKELNDPRKKLDQSKEKYLSLLLSLVESGNHTKVFCSEIQSGMLSGLQRHFQIALRNHIAEEKLELCNRRQVQLAILVELNKEGKFERYRDYLSNFKLFCLAWLRKQVLDFLTEEIRDGLNRFSTMMMELAEDILQKLLDVMEADDGDGHDDYHDFLNDLKRKTQENRIHVGLDEDCMERLRLLDVQDVHRFVEDVQEHLQGEAKAVIQEQVEALDIEEQLNCIDPPIQEQLYESLMCKDGEQCPFCRAPCDVIGVHAEHRVDMHQPQGLAGCIIQKSITLDTEDCLTSMSLNGTFQDYKTKYKPVKYQQYRTYYPSWNIPADPNPVSANYWKMVMMKFNQEFAEWYGTNPVTIPESWRGLQLQWPVVKKNLEELYEQTIPE